MFEKNGQHADNYGCDFCRKPAQWFDAYNNDCACNEHKGRIKNTKPIEELGCSTIDSED